MNRVGSLVAVAVLSVATLSACSGGDGSEFCDRFRDNAESNEFDDIAGTDVEKIQEELQKFKDIAPDELQDDYDTLIAAAEGKGEDPTEAVKNIQDYAVDNCDVTIEGS